MRRILARQRGLTGRTVIAPGRPVPRRNRLPSARIYPARWCARGFYNPAGFASILGIYRHVLYGSSKVSSLYKNLYNSVMDNTQPIEFRGTSLEDLRTFPLSARREAGYQLDMVQRGGEPNDWRPMATIGKGVREIRIRDASGAFRVIYIAKFADAVYILHCFQKKTQKTSRKDLNVAIQRYQELVKEIK